MALSFGIKQNVGAVTVVYLSCNWEETHGKHTWLRTEEQQMHGRDIWWWLSAVITRLERLKGYWSSHYPQIRQPVSHSTQIFHPSIINNTFLWVNFSLFLKVMSQILNHRQRRKGRNASGTVAEVISQQGIFISPQHQWSSEPACVSSVLPCGVPAATTEEDLNCELTNVFNGVMTKKRK